MRRSVSAVSDRLVRHLRVRPFDIYVGGAWSRRGVECGAVFGDNARLVLWVVWTMRQDGEVYKRGLGREETCTPSFEWPGPYGDGGMGGWSDAVRSPAHMFVTH